MSIDPHDPRDIPLLTDAVEQVSAHAAILTEALELADSLLHQAAKDIEAILFERVYDKLRAQLPEIVDRILREHAPPNG